MTMQVFDDDAYLPSFLMRRDPAPAHMEDAPCNPIKARASDLRGAVGRFLHSMSTKLFRPSLGAFAAGDFNVKNGQDSMTINRNMLLRGQQQMNSRQGDAMGEAATTQAPTSARPRSLVDDIAVAVERLRRIEGERGLYNLLEMLLQDSRKVLAEHGVLPPSTESAELESLHLQLARLKESRDTNHAYAKHFSDALAEIANLDGALTSEAPIIAKKALEVHLQGTQQPKVQ